MPLSQMRVLFVSRIGHGIEEHFEAWKAADVFRGTASFARDEARIVVAGITRSDIFGGGGVTPVVAHVVGIGQVTDAAIDERA